MRVGSPKRLLGLLAGLFAGRMGPDRAVVAAILRQCADSVVENSSVQIWGVVEGLSPAILLSADFNLCGHVGNALA